MKLTSETVRKNTTRYYDSLKRYANLKATTESTTERAFKRLGAFAWPDAYQSVAECYSKISDYS